MLKRAAILLLLLLTSSMVLANSRPLVFVSILPQKYFVEQVAAGLVDIEVMVGPGQNPTTYEPSPRQIAAITKTDLYFSIGVPFESAWLKRISKNNPGMKLVLCCEAINQLDEEHDRHRHGNHGNVDPHIWTDPNNVKLITKLIADELTMLDSDNAEQYRRSAERFLDRLANLDAYIRTRTAPLKKRKMIVSHPSWSYFAEEYGFQQISIEQNGKDIKAASLRNLIDRARSENIKAVFAQPQFNNKAAYIIAEELHARVFALDPLAYDYIENMVKTTDLIAEGLSNE